MAKAKKAIPKDSTRSPRSSPSITQPGDRLVQEGPWCGRSVACRRPRREDHARGIAHRDSRIMLNDPMMGGKPQGARRLTGFALGLRGGLRRAVQPRRFGGRAGSGWAHGRSRISSGAIAAEPSPTARVQWTIATHKEDLTRQELEQRQASG